MILRAFVHLPVAVGEIMILRTVPSECRKGIRLLDPDKNTRAAFLTTIDAALSLLASKDPILFKRVSREIKRIFHLPSHNGPSYSRTLRICTVDFKEVLLLPDTEEQAGILACMLIIASTIGHLETKGIVKSSSNYERVARLCRKKVFLFAGRIGLEMRPGLLEEPIDKPSISDLFKWKKHVIRDIWTNDY
jgi:hypothetical protein